MANSQPIAEPVTPELVTKLYYKYRIARYLLEHPGADPDKAYKYARVAWARKQKSRQRRNGKSI